MKMDMNSSFWISPHGKRFHYQAVSSIYNKCLEYGDITKNKIPVVPATHYTCGGVEINKKDKQTLKNLYVIKGNTLDCMVQTEWP